MVTAGQYQIYPVPAYYEDPVCPNAVWKSWAFHKDPPAGQYDPLGWNSDEWKHYIKTYVIPSAIFSLVILGIGVGTGLGVIMWRLIQWAASCCCKRRCAGGQEDSTFFLADRKHIYYKLALLVLMLAVIGLTIWGMVALDEKLLQYFWQTVQDILDYGSEAASTIDSVQSKMANSTINVLEAAADAVSNNMGSIQGLAEDLAGEASAWASGAQSLQSAANNASAAVATFMAAMEAAAAASRSIATTASSSSSTAGAAAAALVAAVPSILRTPSLQSSQHQALQALLVASSAVLEATYGTEPNAVTGLQQARAAVALPSWSADWASVGGSLAALQGTRDSSAFAELSGLTNAATTGARNATGQVQQLQDWMGDSSSNYTSHEQKAQDSLVRLLQSLDDTFSQKLTVTLRNGTSVPVEDVATTMQHLLNSYIVVNPSNTSSVQPSPSSRSLKATVKQAVSPPTAAVLYTSLPPLHSALAATQLSAALSATGGAAYAAQSLLASLDADALANLKNTVADAYASNITALQERGSGSNSGTLADVDDALARYSASRSPATFSALQAALQNAQDGLQGAADALAGLPQGFADQLQPKLPAVADRAQSVLQAAAPLGDLLQGVAAAAGVQWQTYKQGLQQLEEFADNLPSKEDIRDDVQPALDSAMDTINSTLTSVSNRAHEAAIQLSEPSDTIVEQVVNKASRWMDKNMGNINDWVHIVYCVWMAAYGLIILLILILGPVMYFNHGAGLMTISLLLLILIILTQIVAVAFSIGLSVLKDACDNIEKVAIGEVARGGSPQLTIPMSYYIYNVPPSTNEMLEYTFGINVTEIVTAVEDFWNKFMKAIESILPDADKRDSGNSLSDVVLASAGIQQLNNTVTYMLSLISYRSVHPLYSNTKAVICCDTGNFAYYQWCAITSVGIAMWFVAVGCMYLLGRVDMLPRRTCCSCCRCKPVKVDYRLGWAGGAGAMGVAASPSKAAMYQMDKNDEQEHQQPYAPPQPQPPPQPYYTPPAQQQQQAQMPQYYPLVPANGAVGGQPPKQQSNQLYPAIPV